MDPYNYAPQAAGGPDGAFYPPPSPLSPEHPPPFSLAAAAGGNHGGRGFSSPESDKARIGELAFLKSTLLSDGFFLPADWEESVLGVIAGGLRHGNSQVCLQALDCLLALVPQLRKYELTPHARGLCATLAEVLGDSRPSVRERTQEALGLVAAKVGGGPMAVLEGLGPAIRSSSTSGRNPRVRQEAARCLARLAAGVVAAELDAEERRLLLESLAALALDAAHPDAQLTARTGLGHLLAAAVSQEAVAAMMQELQALGLPAAQLRALLLAGDEPSMAPAGATTMESAEPPPVPAPVAAPTPPVAPSAVSRRGGVGAPPPPGRSNEKEAVVTEHIEGAVEVVPLPVHSERELLEEMEGAVAPGLLASEEQWQARVEALQRLQQLAVGGAGAFEGFVPAIKALHEAITANVCSLRSALSREGMVSVSVLAQTLGEKFAPLADCFLPALLRMAQSNTLLTALSADQCLRCLVACTRQGFPRVLGPLLEGAAGALKNDAARLRCVNAVTLALWRWEEAAFERSVDGVARMIKAAVADKKEPVRAAARQCFWAFHRQFPSAATALLDQGLDAARARLLRKEQQAHAANQPAALDALVPARRYKVVAQYAQPPKAHANPGASSSSAAVPPPPPAGLGSGALRSSTTAAGGITTAAAPAAASSTHSSSTGGARRQSLGPLGLTGVSGPLRVAAPPTVPASSQQQQHGGEDGASASAGGGSSNKLPPAHRAGAPQRVAKPNALPRPGGVGGGAGAAPPAPAGAGAGAGAAAPSSSGEGDNKLPAAAASATSSSGSGGGRMSMSGPLRVMRQPPGTPRAPAPAPPQPKEAETPAAAVVDAAAAGAGTEPPSFPKSASGWEALLRGAEAAQWHERLRCLEEAGARLRDFNAAHAHFAAAEAEEAQQLEQQHGAGLGRVVSVLTRHLHDGNARAAQAAMDAVGEALRLPTPGLVAAAVGPHLDQLLPRVLARTADPKEQLRLAAATALERCCRACDPGAVCAALARALPEQGDRPKAMALEALRAVLPRAGPTYLAATPPAAKALLARLAALLTPPVRCPVAVERAAVGCLHTLHQSLEPAAFAHALAALAAEPQLAVRRALAAVGARVPAVAPAAADDSTIPTGPVAAAAAAAAAAAPQRRARSHSFGGAATSSSSTGGGGMPMPVPVPHHAPDAPLPLPKQPRAGAASAAASTPMFVGDENSAPAGGMPPTGPRIGSGHSGSEAGVPKKAKARTPAAPSPLDQPPEAAAPWALGVLGDAAAPAAAKAQALEALAGALSRGGPALWDRHFGAALHLFLDGVRQWQRHEAAVAVVGAGNAGVAAASPCALLQPVPPLDGGCGGEADAELYQPRGGEEGAAVWASAVKPPQHASTASKQTDPAGQALRLSLRGLRYLVRLARRHREEAAAEQGQHGHGGVDDAAPYAFDPYLEVTAGRLLDCAATPDYEAFTSAERALALLLLLGVGPARAFAFLVGAATTTTTASSSSSTPRLLMALRALTKLLPRVPEPTATAALPTLCPLLIQSVADPEIVVRMTSVACIAALYLRVRDALYPHLHARLRPVHLKLVTIYIKRAEAAQALVVGDPAVVGGKGEVGPVSSPPQPGHGQEEEQQVGVGMGMGMGAARPALSEINAVYNGR